MRSVLTRFSFHCFKDIRKSFIGGTFEQSQNSSMVLSENSFRPIVKPVKKQANGRKKNILKPLTYTKQKEKW